MTPARRQLLRVFAFVFCLGLAWAAFTQHVWEDFYITYRASKNLAVGNGLVFTPGERVHSFTSPIGVLLPAVGSLLTANSSDVGALTLFRLFSIAAYAGAAAIFWRMIRVLDTSLFSALLLVGCVSFESKTVDFVTNGMETGFLLLFFSWALWTLFCTPPSRSRTWHFGLAAAGLMWTRPDSFVYLTALGVGSLCFRKPGDSEPVLSGKIRFLCGAAAICAVVYLPWVLWAWWFYGTPVPHTITAKGLFHEGGLATVIQAVRNFPATFAVAKLEASAIFTPCYGYCAGWPSFLFGLSSVFATIGALLWPLPKVRWEARIASFAAFAGQAYLVLFVRVPVPWYLPIIATATIVALVLVFGQILARCSTGKDSMPRPPAMRPVLITSASIALLGLISLTGFTAYNLRLQQALIEEGNRRPLGEWLRAHARSPRDTVFLESLGYIGFYSGLKMLDYPGLSSPEVVAARKRTNTRSLPPFCFAPLIRDLKPDWIVLRPIEFNTITRSDPTLLDEQYEFIKMFDVRQQIAGHAFIPGRDYLSIDAVFGVFRRLEPTGNGGAEKQ